METRLFGRTGHNSTLAILGGFAFSQASQAETDRLMDLAIERGVNHIDVAPTYGHAEQRLGPCLARGRDRFFLGCKTMERTREGASRELQESLQRLQVESLDLYQIHAVTRQEELDQALQPGGAIEALQQAREDGLTRFLGITGHGVEVPELFLQALERFDFDSVLFPINFVQYGDPDYRAQCEQLLQVCQEREVGTMIIKSITKAPWGDQEQTRITWYQPFEDRELIQAGVDFALSQPVTGICTVGDPGLLPAVLDACENHQPLSPQEQETWIENGKAFQPLFN